MPKKEGSIRKTAYNERVKERDWRLPLKLLLAETARERRRGLLGIREIDFALLIPRCPLIHTFTMKSRIDVLFLRQGKIHKIYEDVPPGTFRGAFAFTCIEMPPGSAKRHDLKVGDTLLADSDSVLS